MSNNNFGKNLRKARENLGLTQEEAAVRCGFRRATGQARWSHYESGHRRPCPSEIEKILAGLGIAADTLFPPTTNTKKPWSKKDERKR